MKKNKIIIIMILIIIVQTVVFAVTDNKHKNVQKNSMNSNELSEEAEEITYDIEPPKYVNASREIHIADDGKEEHRYGISWDKVENAEGYQVIVFEETYEDEKKVVKQYVDVKSNPNKDGEEYIDLLEDHLFGRGIYIGVSAYGKNQDGDELVSDYRLIKYTLE